MKLFRIESTGVTIVVRHVLSVSPADRLSDWDGEEDGAEFVVGLCDEQHGCTAEEGARLVELLQTVTPSEL